MTPTLRFDGAVRPGVLSVDLSVLLRTRMLAQANSGGGKSHLLRALLEQTHGKVLQLVIDPEGEFASLRERFPFVLAGKEGDVPAHPKSAAVLCRRLVEENASAIIDLYDLSMDERREFVKRFLTELMALPRALWKPALVILDEAHIFCPERGSGEAQSTASVIALCTQGRKRGFAAVLATQRISKLHKDAAAELLNKAIGRTGMDVDMKRAGDELGMDKESRLQLRDLAPGEFFVFGPAIGTGVQRVRSSEVQTRHQEASGVLALPPAPANVKALLAKLGDIPAIAAKEAEDVVALQRKVTALEAELRQARAGKGADPAELERAVAQVRREAELRAEHRERQIRAAIETTEADLRAGADRLTALLSVDPKAALDGADATARAMEAARRLTQPAPTFRPPRPPAPLAEGISRTQQRMLDALAEMAELGLHAVSRAQLAAWVGLTHTSGSFSNNLSTLRTAGLIEDLSRTDLKLTLAGVAVADPGANPIRSLDDLHQRALAKVGGTPQRMLQILLQQYPRPVTREVLAHAVGVVHTSGSFSNNLSTLRTLAFLVDTDRTHVRAADILFPEVLSRA